jgi:ribonuclease-3
VSDAARRDAKTELQEWAHQQGKQQGKLQPVYRIVSRTGPDHEPVFVVEVAISGFQPATGTGRSKRIAEQDAAENLLHRQGVWQK